jgi:nucleoside-diphosphate-sugar epimerase
MEIPALHKTRILLTGANGFLGRSILKQLLQAGCSITLGGRRAPEAWSGAFIAFDLRNPLLVKQAFAKPCEFDVVIHAAGTLRGNCLGVNHEGTRNLLAEIAPRSGKWIQISSAGVYRNDLKSLITEETECEQITEYERSKWLADQEVFSRHGSCVILRPTMVAGPGMQGCPLRLCLKAISYGLVPEFDKDAFLNLVHVSDVAGAALHFCRPSASPGENREFILSDDLPLREVVGRMEFVLQKSRPPLLVPNAFVRAAAMVGTAFSSDLFNMRRYAILNSKARFATGRFCSLLPSWPSQGSLSAIDRVCEAYIARTTTRSLTGSPDGFPVSYD